MFIPALYSFYDGIFYRREIDTLMNGLAIKRTLQVIVGAISLIIVVAGCDTLVSVEDPKLEADFYTSDTTGRRTTAFNTGEPLVVNFLLINRSPKTIPYYTGDNIQPQVVFSISNSDTTLYEPYGGSHLIVTRSLPPNDTLTGTWKVHTFLKPGLYTVNVFIPNFQNVQGVCPVNAITFSVAIGGV